MCVCVLPADSQAAGGEQKQSTVCCGKVAATLPLTLLRTANKCRTCTTNVCVREREGAQDEDIQDAHPPPPPSWGVKGAGSVGVSLKAGLSAGRSRQRHFDVFVERLRASNPRSLTLSTTDRREPAEGCAASKLQAI